MSFYEYEYHCPICGQGQNREGICNECAFEQAQKDRKDTLLKVLYDIDVAETQGNENTPYTFEKVINWKGFVETLPENAHNIKLLFDHFRATYRMFLEVHSRNDWKAVNQFTKEIKTTLRLLRSRIIEYLQNL